MLKFVSPLIVVEDIARSRQFYEGVLGQTVKADFVENVAFEGDFAIHRKTHFQELMGGSDALPIAAKANNGELYFETDDVDPIVQRLEAAGVEFLHRVTEQPWGQRVMRFYDPDGHIIEIGETMESLVRRLSGQGLAVDGIVKKTGLPEPYIELLLQSS